MPAKHWNLMLIAMLFIGCTLGPTLRDFESVPLQQPLYRYTIAHRGSLHENFPDNSLPALKEAITAGVPFLEVDVRQATDGTLFLFHDGSLQRDNFTSPLELKGRRVQALSASERGRVRLDQDGTVPIPTLKEALDTIADSETATLQLDLKGESDELLRAVIDLLKREHKIGRALIQLKDPDRIKRIRAEEPAARVLARCKDMQQLEQALAVQVEFVELERWITGEAVTASHNAKIAVVFNVAAPSYDNRDTWEFLRARGVDSLMTDHAGVAR